MADPGKRTGITLSVIVAEALALGDLDKSGTKSQLGGKLVGK